MGELGVYWHDVKEYKKAKALKGRSPSPPPPPQRRCFDWMVTSGCSYARDRESFKTYRSITPIRPLNPMWNTDGPRVVGIGSVELEVLREPGKPDTNTIVLKNVLHTPDSICNGFSTSDVRFHDLRYAMPLRAYKDGRPIFYADSFCGLWRLALTGDPQGESRLAERWGDGSRPLNLMLSCHVTEQDRERLFGSN